MHLVGHQSIHTVCCCGQRQDRMSTQQKGYPHSSVGGMWAVVKGKGQEPSLGSRRLSVCGITVRQPIFLQQRFAFKEIHGKFGWERNLETDCPCNAVFYGGEQPQENHIGGALSLPCPQHGVRCPPLGSHSPPGPYQSSFSVFLQFAASSYFFPSNRFPHAKHLHLVVASIPNV